MIIEEILSKVSMKAPTLLLAIGIFILFWVGGIIFKAIVLRRMDEKKPSCKYFPGSCRYYKKYNAYSGTNNRIGHQGR